MYAAERRRRILDILRSNDSVNVAELSGIFEVSTSTIRRDLNQLHKAALVERIYGGAITSSVQGTEAPFNLRSISYKSQKNRIGRAAAQLVRPGETILLDGGTTTECMLAYLPGIPELTVVTFGLNIVTALAEQGQITLICIGGKLHPPSQTFGGVLALDALQAFNIRFDKSFLAASGISAEGGITNVGFEEIAMKRKTIELSREVILLADSSKVGKNAPGFITPAHKLQRLITDNAASAGEIDRLRQLGVIVDLV